MVKYIGKDKQPEWMFELKDQTHYYLYTNNNKIFISQSPPVKESGDDINWWHPEVNTLKCIQTIYVDLLTEHEYFEFEKWKAKNETIRISEITEANRPR